MILIKIFLLTVMGICLAVQGFEDLRHKLLYDNVSLTLLGAGLAYAFFFGNLLESIYACGLVLIVMFVIYFCSRGGMGLGDVFLAGALGAWLSPFTSALMLVLAFVMGGILALPILIFGKNRKYAVPFAPFLIAAFLLSFFYGKQILDFYFEMW